LFIAADLPDEARKALAAEQKRISATIAGSAGALRWVKPEHSHLTLVFLGEVADALVPALVESIGRDISLEPFQIAFESIGVFPPRGAPGVCGVGVGAGASGVADLPREVAGRVAALGLPVEDRPFRPHLTLARWRDSRPADRERALEAAPRGTIARARVDAA